MSRPWLHFVGVAGSGMSALAQFHAGRGGRATGSDRAFDHGEHPSIRTALERAGVEIVPQDGSCLAPACAAVILSTAIEDSIPDVARARALGIPLKHRSDLLAVYVAQHQTIAVTGTSGKSTVTALVWTILRAGGRDPRLLTGGPAAALEAEGLLGNAWGGTGPDPAFLVIEADESDGSVVRYHPWAGVVLNLGRDHKEPVEVAAMFSEFRLNCSGPFVVGEDRNLDFLRPGAVTFGLGERADVRATDVALGPHGVAFTVEKRRFTVPQPGRHSVLNAAAAIATCRAAGVDLDEMVAPLATFAGVARRFTSLGTAGGVEVIDDFAHNPDKLSAALAAARDRLGGGTGRVLAVFQPHGFGPTRFLRDDLVATLAGALRPQDVLWLPEIYYAGGTVTRDISSADLATAISERGRDARFRAERDALPAMIAAEARPGDLVLVMGARDPALTEFGRAVLAALARRAP
ncbi:MAG TPA: Mur ligase domain-containing protein [Candidatus Krumholzibacteria bacterium]|nr:Mur ligase domain-containing protein [Candidatus Krumholzibacteria bacterium]HPD73154.1 Mur ligase domain-containing protein [Candidatus Krumholzibacteria bacterium]HRY41968.1 Mur ligase domain-containing protein [Candidatus Krumholzibacteria bacterium]